MLKDLLSKLTREMAGDVLGFSSSKQYHAYEKKVKEKNAEQKAASLSETETGTKPQFLEGVLGQLRNASFRNAFKIYLESLERENLILLYSSIEEYRKCQDDDQRRSLAFSIFSLFLDGEEAANPLLFDPEIVGK